MKDSFILSSRWIFSEHPCTNEDKLRCPESKHKLFVNNVFYNNRLVKPYYCYNTKSGFKFFL